MGRARQTLLAIAALALAGLAWRDAAIASWLGTTAPTAPVWLSTDPRVAFAQHRARDASNDERSDAERRQTLAKARTVLKVAPLEVVVMREVALASPEADAQGYARRLALAERLSRHDTSTQLLLFQVAVDAGRDRLALEHIDKVLTVSPEAGEDIYPPLTTLLASADARQALSVYHRRPWYGSFLSVAVQTAPEMTQLLDLLDRGKPTADQAKALLPRLLRRSLDAGDYAQARRIAIAYGGAKPAALDRFGLDQSTLDPLFAPLTWRTASSAAAEIVPSGPGALDVKLTPETRLVLLERVTGLPAGPYMLSQTIGGNDAGESLQLQWAVMCRNAAPAKPFWQQRVPVPSSRVRYRSRVEIPTSCPVQLWQLVANLDGQQNEGNLWIAGLGLRKAGS